MEKLSASEALLGFIGWITSFEEPVTFSAAADYGAALALVDEFCEANGLAPAREGWISALRCPTSRKLGQA